MKQSGIAPTTIERQKQAPGKERQMPDSVNTAKGKTSPKKKGDLPLEKFFTDQLNDIYYAEQQLVKAIPKMEGAATTDALKEMFADQIRQALKQVKRLEKVFSLLAKKPEEKNSKVIEGFIKEAEGIISQTKENSMTRDAALIIAAQKIKHYEIATYGSLVQLALTMHLNDVSDILDTTLMEEEETDFFLTEIAEDKINVEAGKEGSAYS